MTVYGAVRQLSGGVAIDLEVIPGSKSIKVPSGYNPWRKRIEVRLTQAAQKGKANRQLIQKLSEVLKLKESDLILISGQTSHKKTVLIKGMDAEQILTLLDPMIESD